MQNIGFLKTEKMTNDISTTIVPIEFTHSCAIGQTGCGKTTNYIYPNISNRIKLNHGLLVFDYKGKEHLSVKVLANRYKRLDDVIEIGKDWGKSINILKYMNEATLENFLYNLFGLDGTDNEYWGRSATNISLTILKIIGQLEQLVLKASKVDKNINFEKTILRFKNFDYPIIKTLYSLSLVVSSIDTLKGFIENLDDLYNHIVVSIKEIISIEILNDIGKKKIKEKYHEFFYSLEEFKNSLKKGKKELSAFSEFSSNNTTKTLQTILLAINTPLMNIAGIKWLNDDKFDIVKSLNSGKIIILNTNNFSDSVISSYSNAIFKELTKRTSKINKNPISIFVDEAQRVVSSKFDLPVDVLRETKVELFLAFQNEELMIEKLGNNKYISLIKNIKNQYIFKNIGYYEDSDLSKLESFEFYTNKKSQKVQKFKPMFIEKKELFAVELKYQHSLGLHEKYSLKEKDKKRIIIYDEVLLQENIILLMDKNEKTYHRNFFDKDISNKALEKIDSILFEIDDFGNDIENEILDLFNDKLKNLKAS